MKQIPLTKGRCAIVNDCDYAYLAQHKWQYHNKGRTGYARGKQGKSIVRMHRIIAERMGLAIAGAGVEHIDGSGVNNCRRNLRLCNQSQNGANRGCNKNSESGIKGVFWNKHHKKWTAQLRVMRQLHFLGYFDNKLDAAKAYNKAAKKYFGKFARLNPIPGD
jgi:hypothetical protein